MNSVYSDFMNNMNNRSNNFLFHTHLLNTDLSCNWIIKLSHNADKTN